MVRLFALSVLLLFAVSTARAETRVALVIGNGAYHNVGALENPGRDATAVAKALRDVGFQTVQVESNLGHDAMLAALRRFEDAANDADWALVYYAGHGMEVGGVNYLLPVDARLKSDRDVDEEAISLAQVQKRLEGARKIRIVILDACRDNPFVPKMRQTRVASRSVGRGLAAPELPQVGSLVAYAAAPGNVASDGVTSSGNSPYAAAIVKNLTSPNLEVNLFFRRVRADVLRATGSTQEPATYESLPPDQFVFRPITGAPQRIEQAADPKTDVPQMTKPGPDKVASVRPDATDVSNEPGPTPAVPQATPQASVVDPIPAQRAALLVEDKSAAGKTKTFLGKVVWKVTEGSAVQAEVDVPDAKTKVSVTFEKNTDDSLPASHTIKVRFTPGSGSPTGDVGKMATPEMRMETNAKGEGLSGVTVPVTSNQFLVGLTPGNAQMLNVGKFRYMHWVDIPMVLRDGRVAKLTFEQSTDAKQALLTLLDGPLETPSPESSKPESSKPESSATESSTPAVSADIAPADDTPSVNVPPAVAPVVTRPPLNRVAPARVAPAKPRTAVRPAKDLSKAARLRAVERRMLKMGFKRSGQPGNPWYKPVCPKDGGPCQLND